MSPHKSTLSNELKNTMAFIQFVKPIKDEKKNNKTCEAYAIEYTIVERSWLSTLRFHIRMTHYDSNICKLAMKRLEILQDLVESNMIGGEFEVKINLEIAAIENALQADIVDTRSIEAQDRFMSNGILDERGLQILPGMESSKYENEGVTSAASVFRTAHWNNAKDDSSFNQIEQTHHEYLLDENLDETPAESAERQEIEMQPTRAF